MASSIDSSSSLDNKILFAFRFRGAMERAEFSRMVLPDALAR